MVDYQSYERKFKSENERNFKELCPTFIYADKPYYDFLLPRKETTFPRYIKIELINVKKKGRSNRNDYPIIRFRIRKGIWTKVKGADYIVIPFNDSIYFGSVKRINEYIEEKLRYRSYRKKLVRKSFERQRGRGKQAIFFRTPQELADENLLRIIPFSQASHLDELIRKEYEENIENQNL